MKVEHQVRSFEQIFKSYDGVQPLHRFLFAYFKKNKQMGSSDRRWATRYIYSFFRLGKALIGESQIQRLAIGDFLCNQSPSPIVDTYLPDIKDKIYGSVEEKLSFIETSYPSFRLSDLFKFSNDISSDIDEQAFKRSFLTQPDLFIRVPVVDMPQLIGDLERAGLAFNKIGEKTLALSNGTKLEQLVLTHKSYQVQDLSSQKTGAFFKPAKYDYWWDCCAASGGKSLLLHDLEPQIQLLVSDVRENSLNNLQERFQEAGIKKYQKKVLDLLQNNDQDLHHYEFDGILLDAPCTGSGTWGRTPEMLYYFDEHKVSYFAKLQRSIATNVIKYLKPGKPLIYITCSVFKEENEDVVNWLTENLPLELESMEVIKGYNLKADTMFTARLIKKG
ncbi:MAG: RsmB/NOP family class I SAM-dependent RNA methyltransferase [Flavobacterium sp.]|nr:MAG: RsmB/NOP family class I SAM-dependent RNA methyltransferase [Flavobacterium sp.]